MKPLAIDLFCGLGGWADGFLAEGYDVIGYDIDPRFAESYPATFIQADVRDLDGREFRGATVIVASPPCTEFSLARNFHHHGPPTYAPIGRILRPENPDMTCFEAAWRIARDAGVPLVLENVQGAIRYFGRHKARFGSRFLWGDVPPLIPKAGTGWRKEKFIFPWDAKRRAAERARIPLPLARAVARGFLPEGYVNGPPPVRTPAVASAPEAVNAARPLTEEGKA